MRTSAWIAVGLGAALWLPFLALVIQDWLRGRAQRRHERRLVDAILAREESRRIEFEQDHPGRKRLGLREEK